MTISEKARKSRKKILKELLFNEEKIDKIVEVVGKHMNEKCKSKDK